MPCPFIKQTMILEEIENDQINGLIPWNSITAIVWYTNVLLLPRSSVIWLLCSFESLFLYLLPEKYKFVQTMNSCLHHDEYCLTVKSSIYGSVLYKIWHVNKPNHKDYVWVQEHLAWFWIQDFRSFFFVCLFLQNLSKYLKCSVSFN